MFCLPWARLLCYEKIRRHAAVSCELGARFPVEIASVLRALVRYLDLGSVVLEVVGPRRHGCRRRGRRGRRGGRAPVRGDREGQRDGTAPAAGRKTAATAANEASPRSARGRPAPFLAIYILACAHVDALSRRPRVIRLSHLALSSTCLLNAGFYAQQSRVIKASSRQETLD